MKMPGKRIKVVAAFIEKEGRFYAAKRAYGFLEGKWEFPGGKVEEGETPEEAICREIIEELDTEIQVLGLACNVVYDYPNFTLDMDVFRCVPVHGRLSVHQGIHTSEHYFSCEECVEEEWCPADWIVIQKIKEKLNFDDFNSAL